MNQRQAAQELLRVAKDLTAFVFPTKEALAEYLKEHPKADKSHHSVAPSKQTKAPAKDKPTAKPSAKPGQPKPLPKKPVTTKAPTKKTEAKPKVASEKPVVKPKMFKPQALPKPKVLSRGKRILQKYGMKEDDAEVKELHSFKKTLGAKGRGRNLNQLRSDFIKNMSPANYKTRDAFMAAKDRIKKMPV